MRDDPDDDRTASLMTPAKLAQLKVKPKVVSPAAYLDQLAADAGSGHVRRLVDLRHQLEAQLGGRDWRSVAGAGKALHDALEAVDFALVQPRGWLARATGKGKEAAEGFRAQYDQVARSGEAFAEHVRAIEKRLQSEPAVERTLVEIEVEVRALEKIMDQGARWLQDMRNQLKARQAEGGDADVQAQIAQDTARCELLVARLKQLRAASSATQQVVEHCRSAATRRASFMSSLQQVLDEPAKAWRVQGARLADQAGEASAAQGSEAAREARRNLQGALQRVAQDANAVHAQEQALLDEVGALRAPLQAAG
ncbi:MAG TPA: hypothetical protein VHL79_14305 [Ramlibacter sp.]|nr:hypothetical protein [Ramlibacter sp.]